MLFSGIFPQGRMSLGVYIPLQERIGGAVLIILSLYTYHQYLYILFSFFYIHYLSLYIPHSIIFLDRFFLRSKNLFRDSGYTSNFTSPYKTREDYEEEKRASDFFFQEYSYDEHCRYLRDEYKKESYKEENKYLEKKR